MNAVGIKSYSVYIPRLRMERAAIAAAHAWAVPGLSAIAKGERSFCSWDEDAITMSVDAVRALLRSGSLNNINSLTFCSTTAVFSDFLNASVVSAACGLAGSMTALDSTGSLRAGTSALIRALQSSAVGDSVVVAADNRRAKPASAQEMQYGAAGAAFAVGSGDLIARVVAADSNVNQFTDHFRSTGANYDYHWEERWVRDEGYLKIIPDLVGKLLVSNGLSGAQINHFCFASTVPGSALSVAKILKIPADAVVDNLAVRCGDTGAAHPLLLLAAALEKAQPGDRILVVGFGGGCDVLLLEATEPIRDFCAGVSVSQALNDGHKETQYNKFLAFSGELKMDWGMRAEFDAKTSLSQQYRVREQVFSLIGGRCAVCGAAQFPPMPACVRCGALEPMSAVPLADESAQVVTFTADWLSYYPAPPLYVGLVQFDNGARTLMEMVDVEPDQFDVGTRLRMVFRVKDRDDLRDHLRYFWKATPVG